MTLLAFAENAVQLVPDGTVFVHIGMIVAMIWILNRTFYGPISKVIEGRDKKRGGGKGPGAEILEKVEAKQNQYDSAVKEARLKGYEIVGAEREHALAEKQSLVAEAKKSATENEARGEAVLAKQTSEARESISSEADKLAEKISQNILNS